MKDYLGEKRRSSQQRRKMDRKIVAGAEYVITQPMIEKHELVDELMEKFDVPVIIESWMSKETPSPVRRRGIRDTRGHSV